MGCIIDIPVMSVTVSGSGGSDDSIPKSNAGENSGSLAYVDLATISGVAVGKKYYAFSVAVACQNEALFEIVYVDDAAGTPAITILAAFMTTSGESSVATTLDNLIKSIATGTGTQVIKLRAKNLFKASSLYGSLSVREANI